MMVFAVTCKPLSHRHGMCSASFSPGPTSRLPTPHMILAPIHLHTSPPALAQASKSPRAKTQIKIVAEAESAIAKQITKLQKRRAVYVEEFYGLDGC